MRHGHFARVMPSVRASAFLLRLGVPAIPGGAQTSSSRLEAGGGVLTMLDGPLSPQALLSVTLKK